MTTTNHTHTQIGTQTESDAGKERKKSKGTVGASPLCFLLLNRWIDAVRETRATSSEQQLIVIIYSMMDDKKND
jgi:hypothetical protein